MSGLYPYYIETVTISGAVHLKTTSLEVQDVTFVTPLGNANSIVLKTGSSSGSGFSIAKGSSVAVSGRMNLNDLIASGTDGDLLGIGYHK